MNNDNLKGLYETLKKEGYEPPVYEQFEKDMQDEKNLQGAYQTLKNEGYEPPAYETFRSDMGFGGDGSNGDNGVNGKDGSTVTQQHTQPVMGQKGQTVIGGEEQPQYSQEVYDRYDNQEVTRKGVNDIELKSLEDIAAEMEAEKAGSSKTGNGLVSRALGAFGQHDAQNAGIGLGVEAAAEPLPAVKQQDTQQPLEDPLEKRYAQIVQEGNVQESPFQQMVVELLGSGKATTPVEAQQMAYDLNYRYADKTGSSSVGKLLDTIGQPTPEMGTQIDNGWYNEGVQSEIEANAKHLGLNYDDYVRNHVKPAMQRELEQRYGYSEHDAKVLSGRMFENPEHVRKQMEYNAAGNIIGNFMDGAVRKEFSDLDRQASPLRDALDMSGESFLYAKREYNKQTDPEKILSSLLDKQHSLYIDLLTDSRSLNQIQARADALGIGLGDYLDQYVAPQLNNAIVEKFRQVGIERELPKDTMDYVLGGFEDSVGGMLLSRMMNGATRQEFKNEALAMTEAGENPYMDGKPGVLAQGGRLATGMAADFWLWGGWGKIGSKATQQLMKERIAHLAAERGVTEAVAYRLAEEEAGHYLKKGVVNNLFKHVPQSAITMSGAEATTAAVQGIRDRQDMGTIINNTVGQGVHGAFTGTAFGLTGGLMGGLTQGLTGAKRLLGKLAGLEVEAATLYTTEELARMANGEEAFDNPFEGLVESNVKLGFIKASANPVRAIGRLFDAVRHPVKALRAATESQHTLTDEDVADIMSSNDGRTLMDALTAMRPADNAREPGNRLGEVSVEDAEKSAAAYRDFMTDPDRPWIRKQKVARLLGGMLPPPGLEVSAEQVNNGDGTWSVRTRDYDGQTIRLDKYDSLYDADVAIDDMERDLDTNRTEALRQRIDMYDAYRNYSGYLEEEYETAVQKMRSGAELTDGEKQVVYLHQHRGEMLDIQNKLNDGEELSEEENRLGHIYTERFNDYVRRGSASDAFTREWEKANGLPDGSVERAIYSPERDETQQRIADAYREAMEERIEELKNTRQERDDERTIEPIGAIEAAAQPQPAENGGDGASPSYERGRTAIVNNDGGEMRRIGHEVNVADARIARMFSKEEAAAIYQAVESGDKGDLVAIQSQYTEPAKRDAIMKLADALDAAKGMDAAFDEQTAGIEGEVRAEAERYQSEDGRIVPLTLADGSTAFLMNGDPENEYGTVNVAYTDEAGQVQHKQIAARDITSIGEAEPTDAYVVRRSEELRKEQEDSFKNQIGGVDLRTGNTVELTMAGQTAPFRIDGFFDNGDLQLSDEGGEAMRMSRDEVIGMIRATEEKRVGEELDAEEKALKEAEKARKEAEKAEVERLKGVERDRRAQIEEIRDKVLKDSKDGKDFKDGDMEVMGEMGVMGDLGEMEKYLLEHFDSEVDADAFIREQRVALRNYQRDEVQPKIDALQRDLDSYARSEREMTPEELSAVIQQHTQLMRQQEFLNGQAQKLKDASKRVGKTYSGNVGAQGVDAGDARSRRLMTLQKARSYEDKLKKARELYAGDAEASSLFDFESMEPKTIEEYAAEFLGAVPEQGKGIIDFESLQEETGHGGRRVGGDSRGYSAYLAPKGKGESIKALAHKMWERLPEQLHENWTDQDCRNALIEVLSSAQVPTDIRDYILNDRINQAEKYLRAQEEYEEELRMEEWAEAYHIPAGEREAYEESIHQIGEEYSSLTDDDIQKINAIFAEEKVLRDEQDRRSQEMDRQPVAAGDGGEGTGGQGEIRPLSSETADTQDQGRPDGDGQDVGKDEDAAAASVVPDSDVAGGAQGGVSPTPTLPSREGDFGPVYEQFRGKPKEAIAYLRQTKNGEAIGALNHKDVGDIDLVWGEEGSGKSDGYGLAKLVKYHSEVLDNLQEILDDMHVTKHSDNRVQLESDTHQAVVRLTWNDAQKNWLLTAFEKKNSALDNTTDTGETAKRGRQDDTATLQNTVSVGKDTENISNLQENEGKVAAKQQPAEKSASIQGIEGYDADEVLNAVRGDIEMKLEDAGIEGVTIKGMALHGSRMRGDAREDSDLDVVVEYEGDFSEDGLFNILNEVPTTIEGITVDINPITKGKSGTLEEYMKRSRKYDEEKVSKDLKDLKGFKERLATAVEETNTEPTEGQKEAGNYKKGHLSFGGYNFTVENPKGSVRSGKDASGKPWSITMHNTYGYLTGKGHLGKDGDHLDVFINDNADLDLFGNNGNNGNDEKIYIIDQVNADGSFDEHKIMWGFNSEVDAIRNYLMNYSRPWHGLGNITGVDKATFDKWVESSDRKVKPFAETRFGDKRDVAAKVMGEVKRRKEADGLNGSDENNGKHVPVLDKGDYKTYMTPEAREHFANHPRFANLAHRELAFITAAVWDGVVIPVEELAKIPEIVEAEQRVKAKEQMKPFTITDEQAENYAKQLLDIGSAVYENGKMKMVDGKEDFSGPVRQERKAFVIIGRPAGGKSSVFANPLSHQYGARIIDSDVVKEWFDEFDDGYGAGYVQGMSGKVAERAMEIAVQNGDNIVIPRIGGASVIREAVALRAIGYDVQLYYNDVVPETSYMRSNSRFAMTGRFLSLDYLTNIKDKPSKNFSKFAEKSIGEYLDECTEEEVQNLRGRIGRLAGSQQSDLLRALYGRLDAARRGNTHGGVSGYVERSEPDGTSSRIGRESPIFTYAEWKSNDVPKGEKPKEIWNSESGDPLPGSVKKENPVKEHTDGQTAETADRRDKAVVSGGTDAMGSDEAGTDGRVRSGGTEAVASGRPSERKPSGNGRKSVRNGRKSQEGGQQLSLFGDRGDGSGDVAGAVRPESGSRGGKLGGSAASGGSADRRGSVSQQAEAALKPQPTEKDRRADDGSVKTATEKARPLNTRNYLYPKDASDIDNMTPRERLEANVRALEILRTLLLENRSGTPEEIAEMGRFRGWGGIKDVESFYRVESLRYMDRGGSGVYSRLADVIKGLDPDGKRGLLDTIRRSALTSYYTPTDIARAINYFLDKAGFKGGDFLDGSYGVGVLEGTMPKAMQQRTQIHGVELDWLTGQLAKHLYPDADIRIQGFQDVDIADNSMDVVGSNIPFGDIEVFDKKWKNNSDPTHKISQKRIHNYYVVSKIDKTKPGGLLYIMTSNAVMDTPGNKLIREYIADQCEILGAVRLPDNTFKGAGTKVVTDVIFLRKFKDAEDRVRTLNGDNGVNGNYESDILKPFLGTADKKVVVKGAFRTDEVTVRYNGYYGLHPEMMLGEVKAGGQYRGDEFGLTSDMSTSDLAKKMTKLIDKHVIGDRAGKLIDTHRTERKVMEAVRESYVGDGNYVSNGNLIEQNGKFGVLETQRVEGGETIRQFVETPGLKKDAAKIKTMIPLRSTLKKLISEEIGGASDAALSALRSELKKAYDAYVKKYGRLQEKGSKYLDNDIDGFTLRSLEKWKDGKFVGLSDIFEKSTIKPKLRLDDASKKNPTELVTLSLAEFGEIRGSFMEEHLGPHWQELMEGFVFEVPFSDDHYVTRDLYLSGDVKSKLADAERAAASDAKWQKNVEALKEVQPKDIPFVGIGIHMGARWIPDKVYTEFIWDLLGVDGIYGDNGGNRNTSIHYLAEADTFMVSVSPYETSGKAKEWRTNHRKAEDLIECALKNDKTRVQYTVDGESFFDVQETEQANDKIQEIRERFEDWLPQNRERVEELTRLYNDKFNRTVIPHFDGSHLQVPGLQGIELRPHQKDAVWMLINNRGGIIDHIVGAGKTLVMQCAIMEMRRMGIAKKPMIIALKSTVPQIKKEFLEAFPAARVLAPSEKDFTAKNRKKILSQIALNDWDCVILSHENYGMLPHTEEIETGVIREQLDQLEASIQLLQDQRQTDMTKRQKKALEKRKQRLENKMEKLLDRKVDREFTFENLGVDYLFVDECQQLKSLPYTTTHQNVAGLSSPEGSSRATALLCGARYLQELHQGDMGLTLLSGTTISNSLVELYNLLQYVRPNKMAELGFSTFDAWASNFAVNSAELEYNHLNELTTRSRFRNFDNLPELSKLYTEVADVRNDNNLELPKPKKRVHVVTVPATDALREITDACIDMCKRKDGSYFGIPNKTASGKDQPWSLLATNLSTQAAINVKLIDPEMDDGDGGKVKMVCDKVKELYDKFDEWKGTQMIFCDLGVPGPDKAYDVYNDIINRLVNNYGIPREEIVDIHTANTDVKKNELFRKMNNGDVRVLIAGAKNGGTGVNVQQRMVAIHHVDMSWNPANITQEDGRGARQGNWLAKEQNDNHVDIFFYATENSLDLYKYQLVDAKQKMIDRFKTSTTGDERDFSEAAGDDSDFDASAVVAMLSGNPVILDKAKQDKKVEKLLRAKRQYDIEYDQRQHDYESDKRTLSNLEKLVSRNAQDRKIIEKNGFVPDKKGVYPATVKVVVVSQQHAEPVTKTFDKPGEAGQFIHEQMKGNAKVRLEAFGMTANIVVEMGGDLFTTDVVLDAPSGIRYVVELSDNDVAAGTSMRRLLQKVIENGEKYKEGVEQYQRKVSDGDPGEKSWPRQAELDEAIARKKELDEEYKKLQPKEESPDEDSAEAASSEQLPAENTEFSIRQEAAPRKTGIGYKVFVLKDGKLYPPMVANPGGEDTPVGVWLNADAAPVSGTSKTGRPQVKAGGKGTQGGSGQLAYRPGWHLGVIPYALQFGRKDPVTGEKTLFPNNFVWAEVEYANDVDYQEEARQEGINANGKYQHSLAGLKHLPVDGSYMYRTNPDPNTDPWIITGAMRVKRVLKPSEVDEIVKAAGREPQKRQEGSVTDEQVENLNKAITLQRDKEREAHELATKAVMQVLGESGVKYHEVSQEEAQDVLRKAQGRKERSYMDAVERGDIKSAQKMVEAAAKQGMPDTKVVDQDGNPLVVYHGTNLTRKNGSKPFWVFKPGSHFGTAGQAKVRQEGEALFDLKMNQKYGKPVQRELTKTYAVYLDIKNPKRVSDVPADEDEWDGTQQEWWTKQVARAKAQGYDGLVYRNEYEDTEHPADSWIAFSPEQIKSADAVTYDDKGNVIPLSERFDMSKDDIRFQVDTPVFVSNALKAVEGIKQEKATPEQWLKMIEKNGGLKAGEDKWMGLSEWLNQRKTAGHGGSITKQEVLDFIRENQIQVEEVNYSSRRTFNDNGEVESDAPINETRLSYTTEGLDNKREIALTVPTVESWNEGDEIHFGDAGNGRAVAWVRFGETTVPKKEKVIKVVKDFEEPYKNFKGMLVYYPKGEKFTGKDYVVYGKSKDGKMVYVPIMNQEQVAAFDTLDEARNAMNEWYKSHNVGETQYEKVLVIDEIQSKRHQDARDRGYKSEHQRQIYELQAKIDAKEKEKKEYLEQLKQKYGTTRLLEKITNEEKQKFVEISFELDNLIRDKNAVSTVGLVPEAPFEKNWHELAMKRMLRYAAENGYDKVAWTKGEQQAERYNIGNKIEEIVVAPYEAQSPSEVNGKDVKVFYNGTSADLFVAEDGTINSGNPLFRDKNVKEVFGKELADKILSADKFTKINGENLRIGGEGMKGFYDQMLPRFMDKYGKKWGVKTGEVKLPNIQAEGNPSGTVATMWAVDVTPEMKESVMQGQPMFSAGGKEPLVTSEGVVYGYTDGEDIYLTPDGINPETPAHEYGHLWVKAVKKNRPDLWENIKDLMRVDEHSQKVYQKLLGDENYSQIHDNEDKLYEEVLTQMGGRKNRQRFEQAAREVIDEAPTAAEAVKVANVISRIRRAFRKLWDWVGKSLFQIKKFRSVDEVTDRMMYDFVEGNLAAAKPLPAEKDTAQPEFQVGKGKPRKMKGEGMAHYFERLREWDQREKAKKDAAEDGIMEPSREQADAKAHADWARDHAEWERDPDGKAEPMEWDYTQKAEKEYREALQAYEEKIDGYMPERTPELTKEDVIVEREMQVKTPAQKLMNDISEHLAREYDPYTARDAVKDAVIQRRKDIEEVSADDSIYIEGIRRETNRLADELMAKMGVDGARLKTVKLLQTMSDGKVKPQVTGADIRRALPYLIEAPMRRRDLANEANEALEHLGYPARFTADNIKRAEKELDAIRDEAQELLALHKEMAEDGRTEMTVEEQGLYGRVREGARKVADAMNGGGAAAEPQPTEKGPRIGADDVMATLSILTKRVKPEGLKVSEDMPELQPIIGKAKDWYAVAYGWLEDAGMRPDDIGYYKDYVNHVWDKERSDPEAYERYVANRQPTKSRNMRKREIRTLMDGEELGLVPKYDDIADLMGEYSKTNIQSWANKKMLVDLSGIDVVERDESGEPTSMMSLLTSRTPGAFDMDKYDYFEIAGVGPVWVHKAAAKNFGLVFETYEPGKLMGTYDKAASIAKNIELAWSGFHAAALTEVYVAQNVTRPKRATENFYKYLIHDSLLQGQPPAYADPELYKDAARHLVKLGATGDYAPEAMKQVSEQLKDFFGELRMKMGAMGAVGAVGEVVATAVKLVNEGMDKALWTWLHDGLKLCQYKMFREDVMAKAGKEGWSQDRINKALDEAGQYINDEFGGQHFEVIGVSPKTLRMMRRFLLSPDWLLSTQRHFLATFGFGSIYNKANVRNFRDFYRNVWHRGKGNEGQYDGRYSRAKASLACYVLGCMIMYPLVMNALNALLRKKDEEYEAQMEQENPGYVSKYKLAYPEGMKGFEVDNLSLNPFNSFNIFGDYGMGSNAEGKKSHLFAGRYGDGTEMYIRWGKQFREFPELFETEQGDLGFPGPLLKRLMGKSNPNIRFLYDTLNYYTRWDKSKSDEDLEAKWKAWIGDGKLQRNIGIPVGVGANKLWQNYLPFWVPTQSDKEWKPTDMILPSTKGFTPYKARNYFMEFIKAGDEDGIKETFKASVLNGMTSAQISRAFDAARKAVENESRELQLKDGNDIHSVTEAFDASQDLKERKELNSRIRKMLAADAEPPQDWNEFMTAVRAERDGTTEGVTKASEKYLMVATSADVLEDARLAQLKKKASEMKHIHDGMKDNKADGRLLRQWEQQNQKWLDAGKMIKDGESGSESKQGILFWKKQMTGKEANDRKALEMIRKKRKSLLKAVGERVK